MAERDAVELQGKISKLDEDRRLAFGWASVVRKRDGSELLDLQGDAIDLAPMEEAVYDYVLRSRDADVMHERTGVGRLVESILLTPTKMAAMGLEESDVPVGWWVGFKVDDPEVWEGVKRGRYKAFSIAGRGRRRPMSEEE